MDDFSRVMDYCARVKDGRLPSCLYIIKAVERFEADLERDDLTFDRATFERLCRYSRKFRHYKGDKSGKYFEPEDWQLFIFANLIGLKRRSDGKRKYSYADIYVPRKNGKTFLAAVLASWFLIADGESGPEVYTAAVDQAQARLCYDASAELIRNSIYAKYTKPYIWGMKSLENAGVFKPLSKDTKNKDGLNISAAICDERHAWPSTEIYDVIKTGMGARSQPMLLSISTAGTDPSNPYFADIETYKEIMLGMKEKDNHFLMLYTPDEGDRWDDPAVWAKVNPNLGVSLSRTYMESECAEAKLRGGTYKAAFLTKNLNMWVDAPDTWVEDADVMANQGPFDESRLSGAECYVGIDLASKNDISAVAYYFPKFGVVKFRFIVPEAKVTGGDDRVDYRRWREEGWLTVCPGQVLDEEWFMIQLFADLKQWNIRAIAFDPWGMWDLKTKFGKYEPVLIEYQQSMRYMSVPTKRVESDLLKHRYNFLGNPVFRWMMKNVVVFRDANANIKLDKGRSRNKIDGVVALVDAVGGWLQVTGGDAKVLYTTHELRTLPHL